MSSVIIKGDTSGQIEIASPAVAGSNTQTLVAATGTLAPLIAGTAQASTSGTSIDFTNIPSWVKRITVMLSGVSLSGTANILVRIGTSSGIEATGYVSYSSRTGTSTLASAASTTGFNANTASAASAISVAFVITNITGNDWVCHGSGAGADGNGYLLGGQKTLGGTLDRIRITSSNGTDTFDSGTINILYE